MASCMEISNICIQIKTSLLQTLSSPVPDARSTASQVIAKVAGIELPHKQWLELVGSLLSDIHQHQVHVKQATLETLGYLCEEVSPEVVDQDQVNKIFTAVVQGMNKQALPALVPLLLETPNKQKEDHDQDEGASKLAMAGGTCLGLVARTVASI